MLACKTSRQNQSQGRSRRYVYPRGADSTMIHRLSAAIQVRSETRSDKCASALIDSMMVDRLTAGGEGGGGDQQQASTASIDPASTRFLAPASRASHLVSPLVARGLGGRFLMCCQLLAMNPMIRSPAAYSLFKWPAAVASSSCHHQGIQ